MSLFKCKMCGGDLEIVEGASIAECEFCGTRQPVPKAVDENLQNLFNRANALRIKSEFDKAEKIYERIIQADSTQADAYWGLILCKYGIEYVDDPETYEKIPTCHRASYDSIIADDDYKAALANADMSQRILYEKQAHEIDRIQKEILALAQQEEAYDVFICYKETDPSGARTHDSVIANDIYYQLTEEGFKVFYAAITLEGKLGSAYEPIIFAALNSAKVMLAIGTKPEYFSAVWVKNEWSRYLKIVKQDHSKLLIPCYKDMDAYELPEEFAHLQAQDMSKIGFINDLIRGIKKVLQKDEPQPVTVVKETVVSSGDSPNTVSLLKRAFMFLEDGEWTSANEYCEKILDIDPENAQAYLGKLMAELQVRKKSDLKNCENPFDGRSNYKKVIRFGNASLVKEMEQYNADIRERNEAKRKQEEENRKESVYQKAVALAKQQTSEKQIEAMEEFKRIPGYRDADERAKRCDERAMELAYNMVLDLLDGATTSKQLEEIAKLFLQIPGNYPPAKKKAEECRAKAKELAEVERKDAIYDEALELLTAGKDDEDISAIEEAIQEFQSILDWKDSSAQIDRCRAAIADIKDMQERRRIAHEKAVKKRKKIFITICSVAVLIALIGTFAIVRDNSLRNGVVYEKSVYGNYYIVTDYKGSASEVSILSQYRGLPVTSIGANAFSECSSLTSITIPEGVTTIGDNAFYDCSSLTSITIPNSVTSVGNEMFKGCDSLMGVTIGDGVTSIGDQAFRGCESLVSVTIGDGVTSIGDQAFRECESLVSVTIGDGVTSIGDRAFYYCSSLTSIEYTGTIAEWEAIFKDTGWKYGAPAIKVICSDGEVTIT